MSRLKNWSFKDLEIFLRDYKFNLGHIEGSHYFFNGRVNGIDRVVQVIYSKKEKGGQSDKTMKFAVKHSGIPKEYFMEWKASRSVHNEIID